MSAASPIGPTGVYDQEPNDLSNGVILADNLNQMFLLPMNVTRPSVAVQPLQQLGDGNEGQDPGVQMNLATYGMPSDITSDLVDWDVDLMTPSALESMNLV